MKIAIRHLLCLIIIAGLISCKHKEKPPTDEEIHRTAESLVETNRLLVQKDLEKIVAYIKSRNLQMAHTESGLWYHIEKKGTGESVVSGMLVTLDYTVSLLDGTVCYSSDSLGPKQFRVGMGGVESGLEEGILMLNEGSGAIFILPPHLAHGLTGDGNKIPARSIIVYEVELTKVEP